MSRAPQSLITAVRRAKREDRLTDLVAMVLEEHIGFANHVLREAGLPKAVEVRASAQVTTRRGRHPDLEVLGLDERGAAVCRLWSENKTGANYQPDQLPDYAEDLPEHPARHQLITIVDDMSEVPRDEQSPDAPRWRGFTWQQVAVMAWEAGRESSPGVDRPDWQRAARRPQAPASQRILLELLNYLEEEHGVVLNPLGHEHISAFAYMDETIAVLQELVTGAASHTHADLDGELEWSDKSDSLWQCFAAAGTWAEALEGSPDIESANTDHWSSDRIGEPAFGAGYTLPGTVAPVLLASDSQSWRDAVEADGFSVRPSSDGDWLYIRRTKYVAELIPAGATLDAQTRVLGKWLDDALQALARHDPGVQPPPKPVPRRRRKGATESGDNETAGDDA
jgi:hypothetical protein